MSHPLSRPCSSVNGSTQLSSLIVSTCVYVILTYTALGLSNVARAKPLSSSYTSSHLETEREDPMYFLGRFSLVVPESSTQMVTTSSVGFGIYTEDRRHAYGIRFSWMPNPPENPLADDAERYIRMDHAFGPLFDWRFFINPDSRMTFYTAVSAGFVFGSPNKQSQDFAEQNAYLDEPTNQVLPVVEFGLGVVFSKKFGRKNELFLNPEFGLVPGITAPYMSLSAGVNL